MFRSCCSWYGYIFFNVPLDLICYKTSTVPTGSRLDVGVI